MATIVTKTLSIDKNNIEQCCDAQNVSFNVSDHAWRKWLNGSTDGYVILKSEGKAVLYPTETARPFKADSLISASRSAGTCTVDLQFGGVQVHNESYTSGTQKHKSKANITYSAVTNSTKATEIKWHVYGKNGDNQRGDLIELTLYFNQYSAQALIGNGANGVQSVSVSNFTPYYGDTITFGVKLVQGATFDGWYSDSACTQLVSTDTTYSIAPTADVTLYAKATTDATLYNVSAVVGSEITGVSVSDSIVPEGGTATFTAQVNTGCSFEAWYLDDTYTTVVSTENPYTATIIADTTLYAKAHRNSLNMSVGSAEHGTATVSATTVPYGSDVTFTFAPENETWELYGWYSDSALTRLVSEANPYTFTATEDVTLYPKVGKKRYTITLQSPGAVYYQSSTDLSIIAVKTELITVSDMRNLRAGNFAAIDPEKIIAQESKSGSIYADFSISIAATIGSTVALHAEDNTNDYNTTYFLKDDVQISNGPYYVYQTLANATFKTVKANNVDKPRRCNCTAVALDGVEYAEVYPKEVAQGLTTTYTADMNTGYTFAGWFSDEACTTIVSLSNPYSATAPTYTTEDWSATSLTLYAKATKATYSIGVGTAEHCTASVSATTAQYGDEVTFNCVVDEGYEFRGWYSDEGLTQLVSNQTSYSYTVTSNITLYPKIELVAYTVSIVAEQSTRYGATEAELNIIAVDFEALTREERGYLKTGEYDKIAAIKIYDRATDSGSCRERQLKATVRVPQGKYAAIYMPKGKGTTLGAASTFIFYITTETDGGGSRITNWPYYWFKPTQNTTYGINKSSLICNCIAIGGTGILYTDATTPVSAPLDTPTLIDGGTYHAIYSAEVSPGYKFNGWYSDEACTTLVSANNPAYITLPVDTKTSNEISYTLYAKAESTTTSTTGISLKRNGSWLEAKSVYRKVSDTWVADADYCKTLLSQKDRIGTFVHIV